MNVLSTHTHTMIHSRICFCRFSMLYDCYRTAYQPYGTPETPKHSRANEKRRQSLFLTIDNEYLPSFSWIGVSSPLIDAIVVREFRQRGSIEMRTRQLYAINLCII